MKYHRDKINRNVCPNENSINHYILHKCSTKERQEIEEHLIKCPICRREIVILTQANAEIQDKKKWDEIPDQVHIKESALIKDLTDPHESYMDICLRFIREKWEIIRYTGILTPQPSLSLRGNIPEEKDILSNIVKEFNGYNVETDIKEGTKGTIDLQVRVRRTRDGQLESEMNYTLQDEIKQRILEDYTQGGEIFFKGLRPGRYLIKIAHSERVIGNIILDLKK